MVKSTTSKVSSDITDVTENTAKKYLQVMTERNSDSSKYKGVRKRKWGKWVSEIRLPNSRERIWLGSFDSAVKAARAFDAAFYCLRGPNAKFNFPDSPPNIPGGRTLAPSQIQAAAVRFANADTRVGELDHFTPCSSGSDEVERMDSPSRSDSVSDETTHGPIYSSSEMGMDMSFLDQFEMMGSTWDYNSNNIENNHSSISDFGIFPGFDDFTNEFYLPPPLVDDYHEVEEVCDDYTSQGSFLWNF